MISKSSDELTKNTNSKPYKQRNWNINKSQGSV